MNTFKEFLAEMYDREDPEYQRRLAGAMKQIQAQGRAMQPAKVSPEEMERRKAAQAKLAADQKAKEEEHKFRMENDPEYRAKWEEEHKDSIAFWDHYGKERGKPGSRWTGD